jgi:hypothetical protein
MNTPARRTQKTITVANVPSASSLRFFQLITSFASPRFLRLAKRLYPMDKTSVGPPVLMERANVSVLMAINAPVAICVRLSSPTNMEYALDFAQLVATYAPPMEKEVVPVNLRFLRLVKRLYLMGKASVGPPVLMEKANVSVLTARNALVGIPVRL